MGIPVRAAIAGLNRVRSAFRLLLVALWASALGAQTGSIDLQANAGYACFVDEGFCDLPHFYTGSAAHFYLSRRWAFYPEFVFAKGPGVDHDYQLNANLSWTFGSSQRARPYWFFGAGAQLHRGPYGSGGWALIFGGGFGVKAYVSKNVYVAPEVRLGWEPFLRLGIGVGYTFGRR